MSGSGKTTIVIRYLLNSAAVCRFIFDDENRTAPRLRLKPCYTLNELEDSLAGRWSVFNPSRMFPFDERLDRGDLMNATRRAFRWWINWVYECCNRGTGQKMISIPEIWRFCNEDTIPSGFAKIMQMGREIGCHVICDTQRPELVNEGVIGQSTEFVLFKLQPTATDALRTVRKMFPNAPQIEKPEWPLGQFWSVNVLSGATLTGRMF